MAINVIQGIAVVAAISYVDIVCEPSWQEIDVQATVSFPDVLAVEVVNPIDSIALSFSTSRADAIVVGDLAAKTIQKARADTISPFDVFRRSVSKVLSENVNLADNISLTLIFQRTFSETVQIIEVPALSFNSGTTADTLTSQDQATKTISKSFADSITVTDALTFSIALALSENQGLADSYSYVVEKEKTLDDGSTVGDAYAQEMQKVFAESSSVVDVATLTISKVLSDTITLADNISKEFSTAFAETATLTDLLDKFLVIEEILTDSSSLTDDGITYSFTKQQADTLYLLDDMDGDLTYSFIKSIGHMLLPTDQASLEAALGKADNVALSSNGSLISQGYCDITYFAEDYVGEARTFT
jgi:hypothetical protein